MTCPHCNQRVKEIKHALYYELICACRVDVDISRGKLIARWGNVEKG